MASRLIREAYLSGTGALSAVTVAHLAQMSRKLRLVPLGNNAQRANGLYGGSCWNLVENYPQPVDEAVLARLRHAIAVEDGAEEKQLNGVLRMLGAEAPDKTQLPLFGKAPGS